MASKDKSNTVSDPRAAALEQERVMAKRVEDLCRAFCRGFGMNEERWRSFEIDAKRHIIATDFLAEQTALEEPEPAAA